AQRSSPAQKANPASLSAPDTSSAKKSKTSNVPAPEASTAPSSAAKKAKDALKKGLGGFGL
ncbi:MAG: hypothetical protein AAGJ35_06245, partial [Myxococcota bacterium]